jgi:hypothetical protein
MESHETKLYASPIRGRNELAPPRAIFSKPCVTFPPDRNSLARPCVTLARPCAGDAQNGSDWGATVLVAAPANFFRAFFIIVIFGSTFRTGITTNFNI